MSTTPDYAGLIALLQNAVTDWDGTQEVDGAELVKPINCGQARQIIAEFRTLLESNAALERERDEQWKRADVLAQQNAYHKDRAETAEAQLAALTGPEGDMRDYHDGVVVSLMAERDRLAEIVTRFLQAHNDGPGLIDCMDNDGERYTSQFLDETIRAARAYRDKGRE